MLQRILTEGPDTEESDDGPRPEVRNPKRSNSSATEHWYQFYAGYSATFVRDALRALELPSRGYVLDPWNGTGTTTAVAQKLGYASAGLDLNPSMAVIAKGRHVGRSRLQELPALARSMFIHDRRRSNASLPDDPLGAWFGPTTTGRLRRLERALHAPTPHPASNRALVMDSAAIKHMPGEIALLYVALFKTVRRLLHPYRSTNPTWLRLPAPGQRRLGVSADEIEELFLSVVDRLCSYIQERADRGNTLQYADIDVDIQVGDAGRMPYRNGQFDAVVTSPPYCTRIDYAVATRAELAVLGYQERDQVARLRRQLTGTPLVSGSSEWPVHEHWGASCREFLRHVREHPSRDSSSYYWKTHVQYFAALARSLQEIDRVLRPGGACVLVVQDSYYKDVHNDVPLIVEEMATYLGWSKLWRYDFVAGNSLVDINSRAARDRARNVESAVFFQKPQG